MGIKAGVFLTLTLTLIPLGIQMRCKWGRLDEFIKKIFPVLPFFHIGKNYWTLILFFLFYLLLVPFLSIVGPSGAFSPSEPPWKGKVPPLRRAHQTFWCSLARECSVQVPLALAQILLEEKRPSQSGLLENHARVEQVVPFQDDHKHRQEFRAVLFPFSREDLHRFPLRVRAVSPYRRKTPGPMGFQLAKTRVKAALGALINHRI